MLTNRAAVLGLIRGTPSFETLLNDQAAHLLSAACCPIGSYACLITGGRSVARAWATRVAVSKSIPPFSASSSAARPSARYSSASSRESDLRRHRLVYS